jgi:hypothetical protein
MTTTATSQRSRSSIEMVTQMGTVTSNNQEEEDAYMVMLIL